jgi:hypothetical protein
MDSYDRLLPPPSIPLHRQSTSTKTSIDPQPLILNVGLRTAVPHPILLQLTSHQEWVASHGRGGDNPCPRASRAMRPARAAIHTEWRQLDPRRRARQISQPLPLQWGILSRHEEMVGVKHFYLSPEPGASWMQSPDHPDKKETGVVRVEDKCRSSKASSSLSSM